MRLADFLLVKSLQKTNDLEISRKPGAVILNVGDETKDFRDQLMVLNRQRHVIFVDEIDFDFEVATKREHYVKENHYIYSDPDKVIEDCFDSLAVCVADVNTAYRGIDHFVTTLRQDRRFSDEEGIIQSGERLAQAFLDQLFRSQLYTRDGYFPYQFSRLVAHQYPLLSLIK